MNKIILLSLIFHVACNKEKVQLEENKAQDLTCDVDVNVVMHLPLPEHMCYLYGLIDEPCFSDGSLDSANALRLVFSHDRRKDEILTITEKDNCASMFLKPLYLLSLMPTITW